MTRENSIETEHHENYGKNVTIHAHFLRHGEKEFSNITAETNLSEVGKTKAADFGASLEKRRAIKGFTSPTQRTEETANYITWNSPTGKLMKLRKLDELAFHYDQKGFFAQEAQKIKREALNKDYQTEQMDYYLNFGDNRPDPKTYSPVESAASIASRINTYINMSDRLYSNSDVDLINTTHDFPIGSFLKEVIIQEVDGEKIKGFRNIQEIGGGIDFNEGFEIIIHTDQTGKKTISLRLRGNEYGINMDRFRELVSIGKNLKEEEANE